MTHLDPAYCADGCGRLAETERPVTNELVCGPCKAAWLDAVVKRALGEPLEDR